MCEYQPTVPVLTLHLGKIKQAFQCCQILDQKKSHVFEDNDDWLEFSLKVTEVCVHVSVLYCPLENCPYYVHAYIGLVAKLETAMT